MSNHHHHSTTAATLAVCDSYINKEEQFKGRLQDSQKYCRLLCDRFRHADDNADNNNMTNGGGGGDSNIEALLLSIAAQAEGSTADDNNNDTTPFLTQAQVKSFFDKHRKRLKEAAEKNVATSRQVDNLIGSLRLLKQKVVQEEDAKMQDGNGNTNEENEGNNNNNSNDNDTDDELTNYETVISELMEQHDANTPKLELWQDSEYRKVCENLGEQLPSNGAGRAAGRRQQSGDDDDDDDDIQFVPTAASQANSLKCPITTMWMENPHKNKVCGHTYGFQAILQMMRQGGGHCKCPVAGCNNGRVTQQQLEKDLETEYAIKRRRRQEEHQSQQRASQADDLDEDDDEE